MIKKYDEFLLENDNQNIIEVIPMDIRKKYNSKAYNEEDVNNFYDIMAEKDIHEIADFYKDRWKPEYKGGPIYKPGKYKLLNLISEQIFEKNGEYVEYMRNLLMGKKVGYYNYGDDKKDHYYYVIPVVRRVEYNTWGMLVVAGGGGFLGENPGIGAHYGGPIDERMPLKIFEPTTKITEQDPFGEEDWSEK